MMILGVPLLQETSIFLMIVDLWIPHVGGICRHGMYRIQPIRYFLPLQLVVREKMIVQYVSPHILGVLHPMFIMFAFQLLRCFRWSPSKINCSTVSCKLLFFGDESTKTVLVYKIRLHELDLIINIQGVDHQLLLVRGNGWGAITFDPLGTRHIFSKFV